MDRPWIFEDDVYLFTEYLLCIDLMVVLRFYTRYNEKITQHMSMDKHELFNYSV